MFSLVNGIRLGDERIIANGMGCFAAQLIQSLKNGPGDVYIYPVTSEPWDVEYVYHVKPDGEKITVVCESL